ncbi:MAG TPA: glucose-6-phosphate isomerase [Thermovirgaceae bacterium]|nr:glucose-6-phosphate isomerase [Thermovirgaceae bacterium]
MDERLIRIDYGTAFPGLDPEREIGSVKELLLSSSGKIREGAREGKEGFGWFNLPEADTGPVWRHAEWLRSFDTVIQTGIGGSALGNQMLSRALTHPYYNELTAEERGGPRFYVADNADPESVSSILEMTDPSRTAFIVASKSGATAETMANFLFSLDFLGRNGVEDPASNIIVITDPQKGALRTFAEETGCRVMSVPGNVGGRYSVLSPVGLLSAASQGADIQAILRGASAMKKQISGTEGKTGNPAWVIAAASMRNYLAGRNMVVLMPYSDRLEAFSEWFCQLWAESLGKDGRGSTPVRALGAIDQHSQVQLYAEGPDDKLYIFITVEERAEVIIPEPQLKSLESLSYLGGKGMGEMLGLEAMSTAAALIKANRPVMGISVPSVDAFRLGGLIFLFEYATAIAGIAQGIDPFDQPGVEQGKRYTYGLMQRPGFGKYAEEAREISSFSRRNSIII